MSTTQIAILAITQVVCGILGYGITYAYFQKEYSLIAEKSVAEDRQIAAFFALLSFVPLVIFTPYILSGFAKHGLKFK